MKFLLLLTIVVIAGALADMAWAAPAAKPSVPAPSAKETPKAIETETTPDLAGLRVVSVAPKSFLDQMGIQKNDVLTSLNGQPVTSLADIETFFRERKSKLVSLELLRNGRPETFTYDLK